MTGWLLFMTSSQPVYAAMQNFFIENLIAVFFVYGLSFFVMGLAILLEVTRSVENEFAHALQPLAVFGLIHGSHEWLEMFLMIDQRINGTIPGDMISYLRLALLSSSFLALFGFGLRLVARRLRRVQVMLALLAALLVWATGMIIILSFTSSLSDGFRSADVFTRYSLAIPGALLSAFGLEMQRRRFYRNRLWRYSWDAALAALAFLIYGVVGQLFVAPSRIFPSSYFNTEAFLAWFGFPVQVLRAAMAVMSSVFIIRLLHGFQEETDVRLRSIAEAQEIERRRLEALRTELLHRTVKAQESERQRIARELHDVTGQTLTALSMGLSGVKENIQQNPTRASHQAAQMAELATAGVAELQRLVAGLHPPQLDDLGLVAALRWLASDAAKSTGVAIDIRPQGSLGEITGDVRIALYRIAQEAITNVIRHARAKNIGIDIYWDGDELVMEIRDDGCGFEPEEVFRPGAERPCWGLMGMQERADLINAHLDIQSALDKGTLVMIRVPMEEVRT